MEEFLRAVGAPVGIDPELAGTGRRVAEAFATEFLAGYDEDPAQILAESTRATSSGLVIVRDISITTMCPHHLMPAKGIAHLGYLPASSIVGFGALVRLLSCFSRRLSLQETLGENIVEALSTHLGARGAGCVLRLDSTCLSARGERAHGATTLTHAFRGTFASDSAARAEFLGALGEAATSP
jgi:GTP cyclohydrolase I